MDPQEYLRMAAVEDEMWWYQSLHRRLYTCMTWRRPVDHRKCRVLDAGCGTGGFMKFLFAQEPDWSLQGLEIMPQAAKLAEERSQCAVTVGSVNSLPWSDNTFDVIVSADVLCHRSVKVEQALCEFHRCLAAQGILVLNLPAYPWLMSYHDRHVHTAQRFTACSLRALLAGAGLQVDYLSYWNTILFPIIVVRRKLLGWLSPDVSDVRRYAAFSNSLLNALMRFEEHLQRPPRGLPFGLSVIAVASRT